MKKAIIGMAALVMMAGCTPSAEQVNATARISRRTRGLENLASAIFS